MHVLKSWKSVFFTTPCVASVSVGFRGKELPREKREALAPISRGQNTVPAFFAPQPHGNACYAGYITSQFLS